MEERTSTVFAADLSADQNLNVLTKISKLLARIGLGEVELHRRLVAIKIHFGERGNNAYVRPVYAAQVVSFLVGKGAKPFLTDTNTLYVGSRAESVSHLWTAVQNGFDPAVMGAPVIIAGGLRGTDGRPVSIDGTHFAAVEIAPEILEADILVGITHFKGHEMSGFGGTLKNFGMGCASRRGKLAMHSRVTPVVHEEACNGCRLCVRWCAHAAIAVAGEKSRIDPRRCVGCGACIPTCPREAIRIVWDEGTRDMQQKMAEHACGALRGHLPDRAFFLNFIMQVSPLCDCYPFAGAPLVPDIGILASRDPVALDQASADLVNHARGLESSSLPEAGRAPGADKFRALHPGVDWTVQLAHAESLGLGRRAYTLVEI